MIEVLHVEFDLVEECLDASTHCAVTFGLGEMLLPARSSNFRRNGRCGQTLFKIATTMTGSGLPQNLLEACVFCCGNS